MKYLLSLLVIVSFSATAQTKIIDTTVIGAGELKCKHDWYYNDKKTEAICGKCLRYIKWQERNFESLKQKYYGVILGLGSGYDEGYNTHPLGQFYYPMPIPVPAPQASDSTILFGY